MKRYTEASHCAREAWEARIKHVRASTTWAASADERPERRAVCEIRARWEACAAAWAGPSGGAVRP